VVSMSFMFMKAQRPIGINAFARALRL